MSWKTVTDNSSFALAFVLLIALVVSGSAWQNVLLFTSSFLLALYVVGTLIHRLSQPRQALNR